LLLTVISPFCVLEHFHSRWESCPTLNLPVDVSFHFALVFVKPTQTLAGLERFAADKLRRARR
jgi:hypothetical protein